MAKRNKYKFCLKFFVYLTFVTLGAGVHAHAASYHTPSWHAMAITNPASGQSRDPVAHGPSLLVLAAHTDWSLIVENASQIIGGSFTQAVEAALRTAITRRKHTPRREPAGRASHATLFGAVAVKFGKIRAADRLSRAIATGSLTGSMPADCSLTRCARRVSAIRRVSGSNQSFMELVRSVNHAVNSQIRYRPDNETSGKVDHWALPAETLLRGTGDCEDYAILKMAMLEQAGVPAKSMSVLVLKDTDRQLYHAVLTIRTNAGFLILDNVRNAVLFDHDIPQYAPLFSVSAKGNHIYGYRQGTEVALADGLDAISPGAGY